MNGKMLLEKLHYEEGKRDQLLSQVVVEKANLRRISKDLHRHEVALAIVREVALITQRQIEIHINDICSSAMDAVFPNPYEFQMEFIEQRGKTEAVISFVRNGEKIHPLSSAGGGPINIAAFTLRALSLSMLKSKNRQLLLLDEPFRFLSEDLQNSASQLLSEISEKLGIQMLIISHNENFTEYADKIFTVPTS